MRLASCLLLTAAVSACPAPKSGETAPPVIHAESMPVGGPPGYAGAGPVIGGDKPSLPSATAVSATTPRIDELPPVFVDAAERITAAAQGRTRAWELLAVLSDTFGHRLSGSRALEKAIDWSIEQMKRDGLDNPRREKVMVPHWVRGAERARVVAPIERDLVILGLGGTVGGKVRGEIAVVDSLAEIATRGAELRGKIVVINQPMPRFDHERHETHYGDTVRIRGSGASEAAKVGATAVLVRSVTANSLRSPHTGALRYEDGVKKIPAAAVTLEDAELWLAWPAAARPRSSCRSGPRRCPTARAPTRSPSCGGASCPTRSW
ncbi:hypothetical protein [Nannocystis pusilla]|uniref:hypothetical protein n=1 Tax=Nannocystis pusilla TaxID=889268 RepID=UPI003DA61475